MAHFAELDENNVVLRVIVVHNNELLDANGVEQEVLGQVFCNNMLGGNWKQTSYNGNFRGRYAGIGFTYDSTSNIFIAPKPFPSWTLDGSFKWIPPTPYPVDGQNYTWDETAQTWATPVLDKV